MIRCCMFLFCFVLATTVEADSINSATITKSTLKAFPNCVHYRFPTHVCFWISKLGKVNTTPVLSHYLPDLVVTVFSKPKDSPWFEINKIVDKAGKPIEQGIVHGMTGFDAGNGNHSFQEEYEQNVVFKEADVIGNPALLVIPSLGLLPSTAKPWKLYFVSMVDSLLWRGLPPASIPEEGTALGLNITRHIGKGLTNWGGLYPHEGKVLSDNDAKAAMVIAARAADLVTNRPLGHIYQKLSTECGEHCDAARIQENSEETYFQMIYPIEQNDCLILGDNESYSPDMLNNKGAYVWIVWRHYEGCADGDGFYLGRS